MSEPVLFVTNHAPGFRVGAFAALHERENVVFALVGGDVRHGGAPADGDLPFPVLRPREHEVAGLVRGHRAVIAGLSGKVALPAAWLGARRANVPFVLWATIWAHPRTPAHALSYVPLQRIYRDADAIATYGRHVSAYVRRHGARGPVFEAPQAVDSAFWTTSANAPKRQSAYQVGFVGRMTGEKGVAVLISAWRASGLRAPAAALVLVGGGRFRAPPLATGAVLPVGPQPPDEVRNFIAGSDVLVVPSIPTRDFKEPWGLVVNEAFHQGVPVIATDAVGAVAGGLVQHERNGLVVPAGDATALASAIRRLHDEPELRARLGAAARQDVAPYTQAAWAEGMSRALAAVCASRGNGEGPRIDPGGPIP
jgi:glycosyltransferase involved in cell wall biosynthesis